MPLFIPITKVNVAQRLVYGTLSEEVPDKAGEILDYETSKPAFQEWSQQFHEASGGKSLGNVRAMHGNIAAGKLTDIHFDDENKRIEGVAKVVDDDAWNKVLEGVYTGFSIGGGYTRRWPDPNKPGLMRYTPTLSEVSLVDNPAVASATFSVIKNDGSMELRHFAPAVAKAEHTKATLRDNLIWLQGQETKDDIQEHVHALLAFLDDEEAPVEKNSSLHKTIVLLQKRLEALEALPLPPRGALKVMHKSDDYKGAADVNVSTASRAHELIKLALANPNTI